MKEREPLNFASTTRAPPVGRRCAILGGGIFNRNYGEFSTGVDSVQDCTAETDRPSVIGVHEGDVPKFACASTVLRRPTGAAIAGVHDRACRTVCPTDELGICTHG